MQPLEILYHDQQYIAVDKPEGMLIHRTRRSDGTEFVLQCLRDQLGERLFPVHRLDRPTSGVVIFGRSSEAASALCKLFEARRVEKTYLAVVRGYTDEQGVIDYPLRKEKQDRTQSPREAVTAYQRLATVELDIPVGRYPKARYSLVEVYPKTGRMHQIRRHFEHIFHPLIGDTTHGEGRHNRLFREHFGISRLLLVGKRLCFEHPYLKVPVRISAGVGPEIEALFKRFGWSTYG